MLDPVPVSLPAPAMHLTRKIDPRPDALDHRKPRPMIDTEGKAKSGLMELLHPPSMCCPLPAPPIVMRVTRNGAHTVATRP